MGGRRWSNSGAGDHQGFDKIKVWLKGSQAKFLSNPSREAGFSPTVEDQVAKEFDPASILETRAEPIENIKATVVELYAGNQENAVVFLRSPNPNLADRIPIEFMEQGDFRPVGRLMHAMEHREMS